MGVGCQRGRLSCFWRFLGWLITTCRALFYAMIYAGMLWFYVKMSVCGLTFFTFGLGGADHIGVIYYVSSTLFRYFIFCHLP